jgi:hypothetical protein
MARTWALMAVGAGPDEGTSSLLATGSREDLARRAVLMRLGKRWRVGALVLVPADHPSTRRAHVATSGDEEAHLDRDRHVG